MRILLMDSPTDPKLDEFIQSILPPAANAGVSEETSLKTLPTRASAAILGLVAVAVVLILYIARPTGPKAQNDGLSSPPKLSAHEQSVAGAETVGPPPADSDSKKSEPSGTLTPTQTPTPEPTATPTPTTAPDPTHTPTPTEAPTPTPEPTAMLIDTPTPVPPLTE